MELIKRYKWVIIIVLPIIILVLIKSLGTTRFKSDASRWAEPSVNGSNILRIDELDKIAGDPLIINLDKEQRGAAIGGIKTLTIPEDSIIIRKNLKIIRTHEGPVILSSQDIAGKARVWMVLSQLGNRNIYILSDSVDDEVMKYKFRPDTLVRPEL